MGIVLVEAIVIFTFCLLSDLRSALKGKNLHLYQQTLTFNSIALRKAKIVYNFGLSECNRVKITPYFGSASLSGEGNRKSLKLLPFV